MESRAHESTEGHSRWGPESAVGWALVTWFQGWSRSPEALSGHRTSVCEAWGPSSPCWWPHPQGQPTSSSETHHAYQPLLPPSPPLQSPPATSTVMPQVRSTPRSREAKGKRTETSRLAKSRCRRSGESPCSARSPTPTSSSTWMNSCSTRWAVGALGRERWGQGSHAEWPQTSLGGYCPLVVFWTVTPKLLSCGNRKARSMVPTHRRFWKSHASVCVWLLLVFCKTQLGFPWDRLEPAVILFCAHTDMPANVCLITRTAQNEASDSGTQPHPSPTEIAQSTQACAHVGCMPGRCILFCGSCPGSLRSAGWRHLVCCLTAPLGGSFLLSPHEEALVSRITF